MILRALFCYFHTNARCDCVYIFFLQYTFKIFILNSTLYLKNIILPRVFFLFLFPRKAYLLLIFVIFSVDAATLSLCSTLF